VVILVALLGVGVGAVLALLADAASMSDIGGPGWSLRGNGALVVPLAGGTAALAAGWVALAYWRTAKRGILVGGLIAGMVTLVLELTASFAPIALFGGAWSSIGVDAAVATPALLLFLVALAVACGLGLAAWMAGPRPRPMLVAGGVVAALAVAVILLARPLTFYLLPLLVPVGVAAPPLRVRVPPACEGSAKAPATWAACAVLLVALVAGFLIAQSSP